MVPVSTDDIANAKTNGIEFTLPAPVDLGTLDDFAAWFKTQFNIDLPSADQLPAPLDSIMGKLTTLDVAVDQFHIKVPGTASPTSPPCTHLRCRRCGLTARASR